MLKSLRFVQGAIQKNGVRPELEHFQIKGGRIVGFNGYMALSSPIDLDLEALPKAGLFHKALQACGENIAITQTDAGRLYLKSGAFSAFIPCTERMIYEAAPEGEVFPAPPGLAATFRRMLPFISEDASRPWSMGLSMADGCYTATNNVILLQVWDGHTCPRFNCPRFAVTEIARMDEDPVSIQVSPSSVTFHYPDSRWLRTQRLDEDWPLEMMNKILHGQTKALQPLPDGFFDAVDLLAPFAVDGPSSTLYFLDGTISTGKAGAQEGAAMDLPGLPSGPAFKLKALQMLRGEVAGIDFSLHPRPCLFFGEKSRGALIGLNL